MRIKLIAMALAASSLSAATIAASTNPAQPLLTVHQEEVHNVALTLRDDPAIKAARSAAINRLKQSAPFALADGKTTLDGAVDELINGAALAAADNDPANPKVIWSEHLSYSSGNRSVPATRYGGDNPDRIYRSIGVATTYQYEIKGQRNAAHPSLDFSFEAIPLPALWGKATAALQANNIDVAKDGSFTITADATPANGRRNHLQLAPGTVAILLRDTLSDWKQQLPNTISVRRIDKAEVPAASREAKLANALEQINGTVDSTLTFLNDQVWKKPVNQLNAFKRTISWGVPGGALAINRFSLQDDEALAITLDPASAKYLSIQVTDPWLRSAPYDKRTTNLNNANTIANTDGTITLVLSSKDPAIHNWLDTGGLHDGILVVRWELFDKPNELDKAVREVRTIKLSELVSALPAGTKLVSPGERKQLLAAREAGYQFRLTGL